MEYLSPSEIDALSRAIGNPPLSKVSDYLEKESNPMNPTPYTPKKSSPEAPVNIARAQFAQLHEEDAAEGAKTSIEVQQKLNELKIQLDVILGRQKIPLTKLLKIHPGSVITLDKLAGEPVDIEANGKLIARGEVVVVDDYFGVRILEILNDT